MKLLFCICLSCCLSVALYAQNVSFVDHAAQKASHYQITLRLPAAGLFANEEQQLELRLRDLNRADPVLGPAAVIRARIDATITMPAMPSMPRIVEQAHSEGVPGDYGLHPSFAHGGEYLLSLRIAPPADEPFTVSFALNVADEAPPNQTRMQPFSLALKTEPGRVKAAEPATLQFQFWQLRELRDAAGLLTGKREKVRVTAFDIAHERKLHLLIVSRDFGFFAHEHPEPQSDGSFVLRDFVFPGGGTYQLFADVAPQGAGSQILSIRLQVSGKPAQAQRTDEAEPLQITVVANQTLSAKKTQPFAFNVTRDGAFVNDLQSYLGALGHLMMVHSDGQTLVHAHPDERDEANGKTGRLVFLVRPPKAGSYYAWVEVQYAGEVKRSRFLLDVK